MRVKAQRAPFVENVRWSRPRTVFTTLHVPGSNNALEPWSGAAAPRPAQRKEFRARMQANLGWLDGAFDAASARRAAAVVVAMQADMWPDAASEIETSGFDPIVAKLARRARAFGRPVLVLQGDSHEYKADRPLRDGSPAHGVATQAPNLTRIVVQGSTSVPHQWLRLRVDPRKAAVFSWENVVFGE